MDGNPLVFHEVRTSIQSLIDHAIKNPVTLDARDVDVVDAARAMEGEVWSPQLLAYETWAARRDGEGAAAGRGTDGDLLVVGSLGMGISDEEREALLAQAAAMASTQEGCTADGAGARGDACGRMQADVRGAVQVRQDADGYALVGVDLHKFAAVVGQSDGLAVVLPAYVDGVPVVRVAAEAFARRLVQGVGVRLLVVPDTVRLVAANAFLALSAGHIHLGRNVEVMGEQQCDLAGVSPRLRRREYSVHPANSRYTACEGSLFADGGTRLLFLASPYHAHMRLPDGVECVDAAAFAQGCEPPSVVDCPATLARANSKAWDDSVWRCPEEAPVHRMLARRGVRLAGPCAVDLDGCWYDFDAEGAVLVAGPPKPVSVSRRFAEQAAVRAVALRSDEELDAQTAAALSPFAAAAQAAAEFAAAGDAVSSVDCASAAADDVLALPRQVKGRPLVRIGVRALPWAPASLVVPGTVRVIERDNACRGTKRLVLPEGLEVIGAHCFWSRKLAGPVPVPASVRSVGEGSFEYAVCLLEHTGSIVHVSADQLLSCWLDDPADGVPFDFARYDELLRLGKNLPDRLGALLHRLAVPYRLPDDVREALVARLREEGRAAQERVAREGDRVMVERLVEAGFIDERTFDRQIELLRACNRPDCVAYLMQWHRGQGGFGAEAAAEAPSLRDRFAL